MKLHLGVSDIPYRYDQQQVGKSGRVLKKRKIVAKSITTGEVAERLEEHYHLMEKFYQGNEEWIDSTLAKSLDSSLEAILSGAPVTQDPYGPAASEIEKAFKEAISLQEFDYFIPGVPTQASLKGVNHRLAHPYAKGNPQRPSFRDTGLYQSSIKVWVE